MINNQNQLGILYLQMLQRGMNPLQAMTAAQQGTLPQDPVKGAKAGILHGVVGELFNPKGARITEQSDINSGATGTPEDGMLPRSTNSLAENGINDLVQMLLSTFINKKLS